MSEVRISLIAVITVFFIAFSPYVLAGTSFSSNEKIPVIFDTDICDDIDDTWALALLVQSSEFDVTNKSIIY